MSSLADLLSLGMPQGSLAASAPRGLQFNIPQAPPQPQQQGPSKFRNFLGALGDALMVGGGGQPMYQQRMQQQRENSALSGFLTNPDQAISALMQVNPTLGIELYRGAHPPSEKTMEQKVFEYEQGLDPAQRPAFEKSIALTHPGMMTPLQVEQGTTDGNGNPVGAPPPSANLPHVSDQASYDAVPPGAQYTTPDGHIRQKPGGATGSTSSPNFPVNNPGALRVPGSTAFQRFATPQEGIHAQQALLGRYMGRGLRNVSSIVETYAPRRSRGGDNSDASVNNYIAYVSRRLGVNPQDAISPALLPQLSQAMREFETGRRAD